MDRNVYADNIIRTLTEAGISEERIAQDGVREELLADHATGLRHLHAAVKMCDRYGVPHGITEMGPPIRLTEEGSKAFVAAVLNPPEPSDRMKAAAQRYRDTFGVA